MKSFSDLLETVLAAASSDTERNLTTSTAVKTALQIADTDSDTLIADLIPRVSQLVTDHCRLARDAVGSKPTFARETLRATWYASVDGICRGAELYLPWRLPLHSVDSVVEDGETLTAGTDFIVTGARPVRLQRMSGDTPTEWAAAKIVVTFKAGFASIMSGNVDKALEAACIEQMRAMVMAADRDPMIVGESVDGVGTVTYARSGGEATARALLPAVRDMLAAWRNPLP